MVKSISHVNVWVHDQDEALAFYTEKVGMELRNDVTLPEGFRWLTVGPAGQPDVAFTLMDMTTPGVMEAETLAQIRELVARGAIGALFVQTDDCRATYEELKGRGVEFIEEPTEHPYGIDAPFRDPSGNHIRMVELAA